MDYYTISFARDALPHVGERGPLKSGIFNNAISIVDEDGVELYKAIPEIEDERTKIDNRYISLITLSKITGDPYTTLLYQTKNGDLDFVNVRRGSNTTVRVVPFTRGLPKYV